MLSSGHIVTPPGMALHSCQSVDHFTVLVSDARQHSYTHVIYCVETILCITIRLFLHLQSAITHETMVLKQENGCRPLLRVRVPVYRVHGTMRQQKLLHGVEPVKNMMLFWHAEISGPATF